MKLNPGIDNGDGRQDIIIAEKGVELLIIKEELYKSYGYTYEQIQDPKESSKFLAMFGLALALGTHKG